MVTLQEQMTGAVKALENAGMSKSCAILILKAFSQHSSLEADTLGEYGQKALQRRLEAHASIGDLHDEIRNITESPWMALAIAERGREQCHEASDQPVRILQG